MRTLLRRLGLCLLPVLPAAAPALGADPVAEVQALAARTTRCAEPALSPDGRQLAWWSARGREPGSLFIQDLARPGASPRRVGAGSDPAWAPDSRHLAYLADPRGTGQQQLWCTSLEGGRPRALTRLKGHVASPRWSPDGRSLAFLYVPGGGGEGPLAARAPQVGEIQGVLHNQRLAVVPAAGGALRFASPEDLHVYAYAWSPDGARFAVTAAPGPGDGNWWIAQVMVLDASGARAVYHPRWQVAAPCWSPDGGRIAFLEGLMSDEGVDGGDVMVVPAAGGPARNLTPGRPASPSGLAWRADGTLLFSESVGGGSGLASLDPDTGAATSLWQGGEELALGGGMGNFALAAQGPETAIIRQDYDTPPEVWAGPAGRWRPVTRSNQGLKSPRGRVEDLTWTCEGREVQGWLIHPAAERPGRRYPMVVLVHGGPSGVEKPEWDPVYTGTLSLAGYYLLLPNPRGSYGRGEAFTQANRKDFGGGDLRDILAGVDQVLSDHPVDPARLGVAGWSYGGYMAMWAVTQTTRFRAAVAGAGVANWQSYYGENAIDQWLLPFFGASVYDDPDVYAKSSPIEYVKQVRTPTLILVGERDAECPPPQSFEFWHALKTLGVPTRLVVYPGEGHGFTDPDHRLDRDRRILAWFDQYLGPGC